MKNAKPEIQILIADRRSMLRDGLKRLLDAQPDFTVVADTDSANEMVQVAIDLKPDIALLGQKLAEGSTFAALKKLSKTKTKIRPILMVDSIENKDVVEALKVGIWGIIPMSVETPLLYKGIRSVHKGAYWLSRSDTSDLVNSLRSLSELMEEKTELQNRSLSPQQLQIIKAIGDGCSNKDIAEELGVSERTVKYHLTRIFSKVGVSDRMALARYSLNHQLIREA